MDPPKKNFYRYILLIIFLLIYNYIINKLIKPFKLRKNVAHYHDKYFADVKNFQI